MCGIASWANLLLVSPYTHRVPYLQLDLLPLDVDHPGAELDTDSEVMDRLEPLVGELQQQTRLADAWKRE